MEYRDGSKKPIKITLTGIIRWIFGLLFRVIALGMIIEREYFSAVFMFMVVFVLFPPISNLIESEFNISVSEAVRVLLVIILLAGSFAVEPNHSSSAIIYAHTFQDLITQLRMTMFIIGIGNGMRHLR